MSCHLKEEWICIKIISQEELKVVNVSRIEESKVVKLVGKLQMDLMEEREEGWKNASLKDWIGLVERRKTSKGQEQAWDFSNTMKRPAPSRQFQWKQVTEKFSR